MKNRRRLAIYTFLAVFTAIMIVGVIGGGALLAYMERHYLALEDAATRRRAESVARMIEQYLASGASVEEATSHFQAAVEGAADPKGFLCLVDRAGVVLSHPDPSRVGVSMAGMTLAEHGGGNRSWGEALAEGQATHGLLSGSGQAEPEIMYAVLIQGTEWFASAHVNSVVVQEELADLRTHLGAAGTAIGLLMALLASVSARAIARSYETRIEETNERLEHRVEERTLALRKALDSLRVAHERLVRGEKMNLLGELMSGIAHEIRSPLSSILTGCHIVEHGAKTEKNRQTAGLLREAAQRIADIVDNMLAFARNAPPTRKTVDLKDMILSAVDLIAADLRRDKIELRLDEVSNVPRLELDTQQLQQVLLNLLHNARQALERREGERWIEVSTDSNREAVLLDVRDNGDGIPPDKADRIFAPFFTTKAMGTGLGLALCRRFLEAHGAQLELVPSEVGAHFRITFPRSACETMMIEPQKG